MSTITTPQPPLNLFAVRRLTLTDAWADVLETPTYTIPATAVEPERVEQIADQLLHALICNTGSAEVTVDIRVESGGSIYEIAKAVALAPGAPVAVDVRKAIVQSGEILQARLSAGEADLSLSYIRNAQESYETA
ncbi:MAG: hypothetical protein ACOCYW_06550 [Roseicyclus sp.]